MKVRIHRGTRQIGGTCIELEADGRRVVLDVGLPLDAEDDPALLPRVPGLHEPDPGPVAVVVSHTHEDHYGLAYSVGTLLPDCGAEFVA